VRRYWVDESKITHELVVLDEEVFHHICIVCRQGLKDRFELIANEKAFFGEIIHLGKKNATFKILESRQIQPLKKPHIHLALSLPKFSTLENVLEKSVELGVHSLHLFSSDFSFMKPKTKELDKKAQRWLKIIKGATQQTGRGDLMKLTEIQPLSVLLESQFPSPQRLGLLAYEGDGRPILKNQLENHPENLQEVWIFVGSEGGFSVEDLKLFKNYELLPISLGDQVLRVETACVTLLGILKYELGHFSIKD
jgi:16S rRNA (uracil1498-N3)-methyltransferase